MPENILHSFIDAQNMVYPIALAEMKKGEKFFGGRTGRKNTVDAERKLTGIRFTSFHFRHIHRYKYYHFNMLDAVIGDVIGSIYEFHNIRDYSFPLFHSRCSFTDDTVMTMAVADWLLKDKGHSYEVLEDSMVRFGNAYPDFGYGGAMEHWLFAPDMLHDYNDGFPKPEYEATGGRFPYGSKGNGSAMRVSAVGWFFDTLEETERVAKISAEITHNHPDGIKGAQVTAAAIWMARNGKTKEQIREYVETVHGYPLQGIWAKLNKEYGWQSDCLGTVPPALICFLESVSFEDSIRKAVSIGGDSDTLACINGAIAEAYYGEIPAEMESETLRRLPEQFKTILRNMKEKTAYGNKTANPTKK